MRVRLTLPETGPRRDQGGPERGGGQAVVFQKL